ncbi:MAG TPA: lytic transglycosylase domain-containing protein [Thermoanaerobaculia bacterium]
MTRSPRSFILFAFFAWILSGLTPARAELVVLTDGSVLKVTGYEAEGEVARLTLSFGGRMSLPIDRVERVVDDEVVPEPEPAPAVVAEAPPAPAPPIPLRFSEDQPVPEGPYGKMIYETARKHSVNPQIVAALIRAESAGRVRAVSHKGARGLMQLMPATAQRFGVRKDRLFEPEHNLEAGVRYLSWLLDQFPNDLAKVLAAYNAGENAVIRYGGVPPYRETRTYVRRIFGTLGLTVSEL